MENKSSICHYYVDEAGDPTLFNKKGKSIVGSEGCSRFFMLGLLRVEEPDLLAAELTLLRSNLLADPYFKNVPSMQPKANKTAIAFHAKDDLPEVRREVFNLILSHKDLHFFAVIRDKEKLLSYVRQRNDVEQGYHYDPNNLYDFLVRRLFRDRLHTEDSYRIHFAKRGSSDRTQALKNAIKTAQGRFSEKYQKPSIEIPIEVIPAQSKNITALQVVDYFLWSVQRLFELGEDRYISLLWPKCSLIIDMDDTRNANYGTYYTKKHPLDNAAIKDRDCSA